MDVYGIGNPLIDITVRVTDEDLIALGLEKGTMHLIDLPKKKQILSLLESKNLTDTGAAGSCANTMRGLAALGSKAIISGMVGNDQNSSKYKSLISKGQVIDDLSTCEDLTGSCIVFVTPDGERTMTTFLGSCRSYTKENVSSELIHQSKILYFTGYMWDTQNQKDAILYAISEARKYNKKIIFNLGDPNLVLRNRTEFSKFIGHVDVLISNIDEYKALGSNTLPKITVVTKAEEGSSIMHNNNKIDILPFKTKAVDTTGAGDFYTSGIIYGILKEWTFERAGKLASLFASHIVRQVGTTISDTMIKDLDPIVKA